MSSNSVPNFLPSRHGLRFVNHWGSGPARQWDLGLLHIGIGNPGRGLCGGMVYVTADRFGLGQEAPAEGAAPAYGTPLFKAIVDRQFDSFGPFWTVPLRFWASSALTPERRRIRDSVKVVWPKVKRDIDAGRLSMVGLVREAGWNPLNTGMGHQVVAFRYESGPERIAIGVYDPNHPGNDTVELLIERRDGGEICLSQSTGEPLLALLDLPYSPPRERRGERAAATPPQ